MGLEGLVSERRDCPYHAGRSKHWIKVTNRAHPTMNRLMEALRAIRRLKSSIPDRNAAVYDRSGRLGAIAFAVGTAKGG